MNLSDRASSRLRQRAPFNRLLAAASLVLLLTGVQSAGAAAEYLPQATALTPLLARAQAGLPVVALFSRADCPWCEALRRDQLIHLAREAGEMGIQVVEFDVNESRPFKPHAGRSAGAANGPNLRALPAPVERMPLTPGPKTSPPDERAVAPWWGAASPADLARQMGVRVVPTVVFIGVHDELAPRLVGYPSRDFYGAYLTQRIEEARATLLNQRRPMVPRPNQ